MKSKLQATDLERFLHQASEAGSKDSEASFTIDVSRALDKLSKFQLPNDSAWILKVVQWAVALGASEIKIALANRSTLINIFGISTTAEDVERAIIDVKPETEALNHLSTALRDVAFRQKRHFLLRLAKGKGLVWDGKSLRRISHEYKESLELEVQLTSEGERATRHFRRSRNADLLKALVNKAHTCSVPLKCDGRRLDALEQNPSHGWGPTSQPLMLGAMKGELPSIPIPQFTRSFHPNSSVHTNLQKGKFPEQWWQGRSKEYNLAFLISAHIQLVPKGKSSEWVQQSDKSMVYWVQDGVILDSEPFGRGGLCSVAVFLNAQGLQTDISGLKLAKSSERDRRVESARNLMEEPLISARQWSCEEGLTAADTSQRKFGALFIGMGVMSGAFSVVKPLALIHSAGFLTTGIAIWNAGDSAFRSLVDDIQQALNKL